MNALIGMIASAGQIEGSLSAVSQMQGELSETEQMTGSFDLYKLPENRYTGGYEFAPSDFMQIIETENTHLEQNIIIRPIPSNYGLVEYDGSVITIS